ncbi:MutS-related protein [Pedobacter sp. MR2016-24]|uniref:MutS-related protein n=1 Tax=Pedobacter sp. MR2016-24 TaxID=2994466 RepID=UPI002247DF02|nr:DNA mismatch repair protein MutS [Pedobacter sp. MR2016-24]MCX2482491.1 DNA mismatch repair protein MutS [Pedobacter sp. MR2016-24]
MIKDMVKSKDSILKDYQNSVGIQETLISTLKKTLNNISLLRLALFLAEIILISIVISTGYHWILGLLMFVPVICFMLLVKRQTAVQQELNYAEKLLFIFQNEVAVIAGGKNGYKHGGAFADELHPYSSDLDIYGSGSLYALVNRSNTINGMKILADTLGKPTKRLNITDRQQAIAELTRHIDQTFHFRAGLQNHQPEQLEIIEEKLTHQMPAQLTFIHHKILRLYTQIAPVFSIGLLVLGSVFGGAFWQALAAVLLFNSALTFFYLKQINQVYYGFSGSSSLLNAISGTIKWTEEVKWESSYIKSFFKHEANDVPLSKQIKELSGIIQSFDVRLNFLLAALFNVFLLWDFRCTMKLDSWQRRSSALLIGGLYTISQFEELISFATLNYNEPEWVFPAITETFELKASGIGHPLIEAGKRVINDYEFNINPTVDIITGSNMAGKSTFLRTVGINMVLAFAGAPVCATEMKVSFFEMLTYMRIKDSLNDQTSTFKAELNRLKMILAGVREKAHPLVLIDEMLRGTNSKDKYLGSKVFIQKMIVEQTPALFATHDLQLSEMVEDAPALIRNYHFDIQLAESEMHFDYKLKDGACRTFNAAILLKEIGLSFNPDEHIA